MFALTRHTIDCHGHVDPVVRCPADGCTWARDVVLESWPAAQVMDGEGWPQC